MLEPNRLGQHLLVPSTHGSQPALRRDPGTGVWCQHTNLSGRWGQGQVVDGGCEGLAMYMRGCWSLEGTSLVLTLKMGAHPGSLCVKCLCGVFWSLHLETQRAIGKGCEEIRTLATWDQRSGQAATAKRMKELLRMNQCSIFRTKIGTFLYLDFT